MEQSRSVKLKTFSIFVALILLALLAVYASRFFLPQHPGQSRDGVTRAVAADLGDGLCPAASACETGRAASSLDDCYVGIACSQPRRRVSPLSITTTTFSASVTGGG
jgi:hypothetical protein